MLAYTLYIPRHHVRLYVRIRKVGIAPYAALQYHTSEPPCSQYTYLVCEDTTSLYSGLLIQDIHFELAATSP